MLLISSNYYLTEQIKVSWYCVHCREKQTSKHTYSHKVFYGVDTLLFDDYDNLKFKIEVHHVNIPMQISINWKETLQINVSCMLQPFSNIASKFKYTGCSINLLHAEELWHCQSWHTSYHKRCWWLQFSVYGRLPLLTSKVLEKFGFFLTDKHSLSIISLPRDCFYILKPWTSEYLVPIEKQEQQKFRTQ